ncbi:MAG TPA: septum formation initiator family protein, partial [Candidatus Dorea faecipullorum]|nr:septum formation initiator family protein [Candidatus Dorea faecipullorum]
MLGISAVIMLLVMVVSVSSISLQARNKEYIAQEKELEASIQEEKDRAEEISELEDYVGTDEYIEQTAKDKLGLVHENEIIFKAR